MEARRPRNTLFKRAIVRFSRYDAEVASSPLGRWAYVAFVLGAPLVMIVHQATRSLRLRLAVTWVYGWSSYEHAGIRYLGGRPPRFSDGSIVPTEVEFFVAVVPWILGILGAIWVAFALKRSYEALRGGPLPPTSLQ